MALTAAAKKLMLDALRGAGGITHVGALQAGTALTSVTGVTSTDTFTKTSHGMANGTVVLVSALSGGSGLVAGRPYFVINQATNTFQLSDSPGGSSVDLGTDVTSATVTPYAELSGGSPAYARKTIAFNAAVDPGTMDDSTNGATIDVPGGAKVSALGAYSALTSGTLLDVAPVTEETYAGQGTYVVSDYDISATAGL